MIANPKEKKGEAVIKGEVLKVVNALDIVMLDSMAKMGYSFIVEDGKCSEIRR